MADALTINEELGSIEGKKVTVTHSFKPCH